MHVGVAGASGYAGGEVLRWCAGHPDLDVEVVTAERHAGELVSCHAPSLAAAYPSLRFEATTAAAFSGCDVVFLALPHGRSAALAGSIHAAGALVVDLGADLRLRDPDAWLRWYHEPHGAPDQLVAKLLVAQIAGNGDRHSVRLGPDLAAGEVPQAIVPAQAWQAAESTGDWTLVGCTVAPGFDFATFELAPKGWEPRPHPE